MVQGQSSNCEFGSEPLSISVFEQPKRPKRAGRAIQLLEALQVSRVVDRRRNPRKVSCGKSDDMAPPQAIVGTLIWWICLSKCIFELMVVLRHWVSPWRWC